MACDLKIQNPKINRRSQSDWSNVFSYYAGYPDSFAESIISSAGLSKDSVVLDPWSGSGTTPFSASQLGLSAIGLDINPVMVIVSRARTLASTEADALLALCVEILRQACGHRITCSPDDPLLYWFDVNAANSIRALETTVRKLLLGEMVITPRGANFENVSGISAAFYVAIFNVLKNISGSLKTSNPTWVRRPSHSEEKIYIDGRLVFEMFRDNVKIMARSLAERGDNINIRPGKVELRVADSTEDLGVSNVDFVLTSPPYCTRIDYTSATSLQFALLHPLHNTCIDYLSRRMVGSVKVSREEAKIVPHWGPKCIRFLDQVYNHHSKASSGYYYKTHVDYYDKMYKSLSNISVAMKAGALAVLVVQDSYYKDIHNDVPAILIQFAEIIGFSLERRDDFVVRRSMSGIHRHSKKYGRSGGTVESVICIRKSA